MDELSVLRAAAAPPTALDDPRLGSAHARLRAEIDLARPRRLRAGIGRARPRQLRAGTARARPRWLRRPAGLIAVGAAAAMTVVAMLVSALPGQRTPSAPMVPAAQTLELAAVASLTRPDRVPRADQFVYTWWESWDGRLSESWQSVDGTRDGLSRPAGEPAQPIHGCRDGRRPLVIGVEDGPVPGRFEQCEPDPAYDPRIPTDTTAMVAYLEERNRKDDPESTANSTGKDIMELSARYLRPAQRAALLRAAALIPGLTTAPTTGPDGRPYTSVTWTFGDGTATLVFDGTSHEMIGDDTGLIVVTIVDRVGQRA